MTTKMTTEKDGKEVTVQCSCGSVALRLRGEPIVTVACYCDTCQEGSRLIEGLPNAPAVLDADGGTAYASYRKDRLSYVKGRDLLKDYRLERSIKTNRVVARCCNSAMFMRFGDARHWVPIYRARFANPPAVQMRICTMFAANADDIQNDVPSHPAYPGALMFKLFMSRFAMLFGR